MNYLKTYLNRNKKVSPSSKHSPFPGYGNLAQNEIFDGNMHEGESSGSREFPCWIHASKSSLLPMGNETPSRMRLVETAKFIDTLGAESLEEEKYIFITMEKPTSSSLDDQMDELCGDHRIPSSQLFALRASHSPAVCEFYEPNASIGYLRSHVIYPDYVIDPPRCSWDSAVTCSSSPDYQISFDSPQSSPHMTIIREAYPLPKPPSSPSRSGTKCMPKNLPLPPPVHKEHETSQRSQHMNPWTIQHPFQSSVSPQQCPRNWSKGRTLWKGSFVTVYEALNLDDGSFFVVKISDAETDDPIVRQEIDVLKRLNHPNIVRYLGSSVDDGHLCIFLELVGMGSLRHVLDKYKHFEETMIRTYTRQILWGLEYLHHQNTIHRDLKCANIYVHPNGQVKLADFGVAKQISQSLATSCKDTPLYMAPEMIKSNPKYGLAVDIWSLGCTIIEMADGKGPWSDLEGFSFYFKVDRGELPPIPDHLSLEAKDFLCRCLKVNPEERATVSELLEHPFVTNALAYAPPLGYRFQHI